MDSSSSLNLNNSTSDDTDSLEVKGTNVVDNESGYHPIQAPEIGMVFSSFDEALQFYKAYAERIGFNIRKGQIRRLKDGTIRKHSLLCSKEGFRREKQQEVNVKYRRRETRTGCVARVDFKVDSGQLIVSHFNSNHNHDLVREEHRYMMRMNRNISQSHAVLLNTMDEAGIRPVDGYSYMVQEVGGQKNLGFLQVDYDNFLQNKRNIILEAGDAQSLLEYFKEKLVEDSSFFYTMQVDSENRMTNFFWRDGRSRMDYDYFGDVIIFDTTYRTNKYNMICAPFIGVNHHWQNIFLGCAFLLNETIESFVWLFQTFLEAMGGKQPKSIFTDQCAAMANAIENVMPNTQHRLCLWHIGQNAAKKLSRYYGQPAFKKLFNECLYDSQSEEEFELKWTSLLHQFNLEENSWLQNLYRSRERWCPAFSMDIFSAGFRSSQRSESMHNIFRYHSKKTMTLTKFVKQYEKIAIRRREKELHEDFRCNQSHPIKVLRGNMMENQVADVYAQRVFKIFQEELIGSLSIAIEVIGKDDSAMIYKLTEECIRKRRLVTYDSTSENVKCSCRKFESMGVLCRHALKVLNANNVFEVPAQYILKRWTKDAKGGFVFNAPEAKLITKGQDALVLQRTRLMNKAMIVMSKALLTEETHGLMNDCLDVMLTKIEVILKKKSMGESQVIQEILVCDEEKFKNIEDSLRSDVKVLDPKAIQSKGRSKSRRRLKNCFEKRRKRKVGEASASQTHNNESDQVYVPQMDLINYSSYELPGTNFNYSSVLMDHFSSPMMHRKG